MAGSPNPEPRKPTGAYRGATGNADQGGIGQWIAKQTLHHGTTTGQTGADQSRQQYPWQTDQLQHATVHILISRPECQQFYRGNLYRTHEQAKQYSQHQQNQGNHHKGPRGKTMQRAAPRSARQKSTPRRAIIPAR
jgi:hypothetical protein